MKYDNYMGKRVRSHNYNGDLGFKKPSHGLLYLLEILHADFLEMALFMTLQDLFFM